MSYKIMMHVAVTFKAMPMKGVVAHIVWGY